MPARPAVPDRADGPRGRAAAGGGFIGSTDLLDATLRAAWESLGEAMIVVDADGVLLLANADGLAGLEALGVRVDAGSLTGPARQPLLEPLRRALAGETVRDQEVVAQAGAAAGRRFSVSAFPFAGPHGDGLVLAVWRDVTARWHEQEAHRSDLERLNRLVAGATDYAIVLLDPEGLVQSWGASAEQLLRVAEADALGRSYAASFAPEDRANGLPERTLDLAARYGRAEIDGPRVRGDGSRFWAREVITAQRGDDGTLTGFVRVSHDITREYSARRSAAMLNAQLDAVNAELESRIRDRTSELELANRELEAFSYSVSHDLRAPLRAIRGFAQLLAEDAGATLDPKGREHLDRIQHNTAQMGELIDGLLALSRLHREAGFDEPLDMTELARSAGRTVVPAGWPGTLRIEELPPSHGDPRLVLQVWVNLLQNAVKFTARTPDPRIDVTSELVDGRPGYRVADNGVGFDPRLKDRLFQPFQRLHRAEDFGGTGIGLAIVDRIARRHGGGIDVEASQGGGARFTFTLERMPGAATPEHAPGAGVPQLGGQGG